LKLENYKNKKCRLEKRSAENQFKIIELNKKMKKWRTISIRKISEPKKLNKIKEYRRKKRNTLRKTEGIEESSRTYFRNLQVGCLLCTQNKEISMVVCLVCLWL